MSEETTIQEGAAPQAAAAEESIPADAMKVPQQRLPRFKKKVCRFCHSKEMVIDYKRVDILERFITDRGKILPRRITGTCAKHQRALATEIKRARMIALIPFVEK
jgi:small subunit ribosomal protein S18